MKDIGSTLVALRMTPVMGLCPLLHPFTLLLVWKSQPLKDFQWIHWFYRETIYNCK